ncbi:hypothetical protein PTKIN_Ptkin03bG0183300 [Pterospermum kingtungense]
MLRIEVEDLSSPRASMEKPRRSMSLSAPSLVDIHSFSRKSFSYSKLPEEPIKLSIRKLDGSSFDVEVIKSATIAELKLAVEDVFSHLPKEGPGKISWAHVWGHFCLSSDGQKLVTDTDHITDYGIRDGDQLHFIRHVTSTSTSTYTSTSSTNLTKNRSKKRIVAHKHSYMPISSSASSLESLQNDEEDDDYNDMESGRCHNLDDKNQRFTEEEECQSGQSWRDSSSFSKMSPITESASNGGRGCNSGDGCDIFGNLRKILQLWGSANPPKHTQREK